ncbi:MAG: TlpA family protein disulfide reductase [Polyangiaceae bacterium]|nr:TlpA family protein disulfide reductase [Polyangiaceae bacterium]
MKVSQIASVAFILIASFFVYSFVATAREGETRRACTALCSLKPHYVDQVRRAPEFELPNLRGQLVELSDYRGKTLILNFWSKTCPPCLEEMPSLAQLAHTLAGRTDIALLTITSDESAADAQETLSSILGQDAPFEVLVDPDATVIGDLFGTKLYPETWFIDREGVIRARVDGARDWSKAEVVDMALALDNPIACPVRIHEGRAQGAGASFCGQN